MIVKTLSLIPNDTILVTADVIGLHPSIPHSSGLNALEKVLGKRKEKQITTKGLIKMAEFALTYNYLNILDKVLGQVSGTTTGTKFPTLMPGFIWMKLKENS